MRKTKDEQLLIGQAPGQSIGRVYLFTSCAGPLIAGAIVSFLTIAFTYANYHRVNWWLAFWAAILPSILFWLGQSMDMIRIANSISAAYKATFEAYHVRAELATEYDQPVYDAPKVVERERQPILVNKPNDKLLPSTTTFGYELKTQAADVGKSRRRHQLEKRYGIDGAGEGDIASPLKIVMVETPAGDVDKRDLAEFCKGVFASTTQAYWKKHFKKQSYTNAEAAKVYERCRAYCLHVGILSEPDGRGGTKPTFVSYEKLIEAIPDLTINRTELD